MGFDGYLLLENISHFYCTLRMKRGNILNQRVAGSSAGSSGRFPTSNFALDNLFYDSYAVHLRDFKSAVECVKDLPTVHFKDDKKRGIGKYFNTFNQDARRSLPFGKKHLLDNEIDRIVIAVVANNQEMYKKIGRFANEVDNCYRILDKMFGTVLGDIGLVHELDGPSVNPKHKKQIKETVFSYSDESEYDDYLHGYNALPLNADKNGRKTSGYGLHENTKEVPLAKKKVSWDLFEGNNQDEFNLIREGKEVMPEIPNKQGKFHSNIEVAKKARLCRAIEKSYGVQNESQDVSEESGAKHLEKTVEVNGNDSNKAAVTLKLMRKTTCETWLHVPQFY